MLLDQDPQHPASRAGRTEEVGSLRDGCRGGAEQRRLADAFSRGDQRDAARPGKTSNDGRRGLRRVRILQDLGEAPTSWSGGAARRDGTRVGLARVAGLDATPVRVATRDDHFFKPNIMRSRDLNTYVALVKLNGKDSYFDPGTAFTPFGLLPWAEAGTAGLRLDKDGGTWVTTALAESSASQIVRKADLNLTSDGSLEGKLTVTFTGLEALWRRVGERNEDEAHSKKLLEDYVKEIVPAGIEVLPVRIAVVRKKRTRTRAE